MSSVNPVIGEPLTNLLRLKTTSIISKTRSEVSSSKAKLGPEVFVTKFKFDYHPEEKLSRSRLSKQQFSV